MGDLVHVAIHQVLRDANLPDRPEQADPPGLTPERSTPLEFLSRSRKEAEWEEEAEE